MKFLTPLAACCGAGATVTPAAETTPSAVKEAVGGVLNHGGNSSTHAGVGNPSNGMRKVKPTNRHWKPNLHRISEDGIMVSNDKAIRRSGFGSDDNQQISTKVKPKSAAKAKPIYHGEEYWKSSSLWAIPAFAPSPF